jgi:ferredoxin
VVQGMENLNPPTQQELDFLGDDTSKERLACQCRLKCGSVTIRY